MNFKKVSVYLVALLSFIFVFSISSLNASASTWNKGIPSTIKGNWRSGYERKNTYSKVQKVPVKFVVLINKSYLGYTVLARLQHKYSSKGPMGFMSKYNYRQVTNDARGVATEPIYQVLSHNKYLVKGSTKFTKDAPNRSIYSIKYVGKNLLKIWIKGNKYEPAFHKWTYLGKFNRIHGEILE
ncbi:hypothetical protein MOO46_05185 [Apilactobacillus apisilvae]|uniref:Uncharacterized protein n=1 Tax=Apilactobacillus apisilvae TaxID=2923364 RepID=A0ABY4PG04_9LACO|nr:hypothetical protein [Apilactobacillus apisilvae]UQS84644.1 hypothetical protein MOO46_05185 [Apilactobacillus apisilvae]